MRRLRWMHRGDAALFSREREWLAAVLAALLAGGTARVERRAIDGRVCFAKVSALRGRAAARHAARRALGLPLPRLAEHANLTWLRAHGFDAPRPLLAGAAWSGAVPRLQFLYTAEVADAVTLERLLVERDPRAEAAALELARVAARLHAAGFVHRDLFARNVLVRADTGTAGARNAPALVLLDAWRGGARPGLRGAAYDVGCLVHDLGRLGFADPLGRIVAAYAAERGLRGGRVVTARLTRTVRRVAAARSAREARGRARSGGEGRSSRAAGGAGIDGSDSTT